VIAAQPSLDWPYVDAWAVRIGVLDLLNEVRR
jgi:hypothetical protein